MQKTILLTGATDGIGLETAKMLAGKGHRLLIHGRNAQKLADVEASLKSTASNAQIESYVADLSNLEDVGQLAKDVRAKHDKLDVLINNAGIYKTSQPRTKEGMDVRFVVNTIAPYLLTKELLDLLGNEARVVNLSSAAQAPVDVDALAGKTRLEDMPAYAQSKLAITMWTNHLAGKVAPMVVSVNPGSLLASKMVKEGFGVEGSDIRIGADILVRAALSDEFADASGKYYDNDAKRFGPPHPDGLDAQKCAAVVQVIETLI
ncbi:SDR family NAD(P)-dependent oxidoreductase [Terasakiella sp. SH-1]|uniref:SDR family NAD(P)-dependent oxidoreductase n=1 Tax=Terasakiella sp. SH-1 TaxID=2560057 RepID=UPI0010737AE6|nr:SDR family NAD(P)-dependent oxidoreductase [Terasakiella sp. SH-1]